MDSKKRLRFRHFVGLFVAMTFLGSCVPVHARGLAIKEEETSLKASQLNPLTKIRERKPGSYVPSDEVTPLPFDQTVFLNQILVEDNGGVLNSVKSDIRKWEETEEYARYWNLQSTGLYEVPDAGQRKSYLNKKLVKYLDKRISGEVKAAEQGSTLHKVGQVQKALKPNAEAQVSEKVKIKFRAKVLQGEATMRVDNPWVETNAQINAKGNMQVNAMKDIKALGISTHMKYQIDEGTWVAAVDRPLTEQLKARVSSSQSDKEMAFEENTNRTVELIFSTPF